MNMFDALLAILIILLVVGYIGINFIAELERFLIAENIALAILYAISLWLHLEGQGYIYTASLAWFNAGRVSRSIIEPTGEFGELAKEHVPLLALIVLVALMASLKAAGKQ